MPSGNQDRKLLQLRRERGAKAQELAELLKFVRKLGAMQHRPQRATQFTTRAGDHGIMDAALLRRHVVCWKERNARQRGVSLSLLTMTDACAWKRRTRKKARGSFLVRLGIGGRLRIRPAKFAQNLLGVLAEQGRRPLVRQR